MWETYRVERAAAASAMSEAIGLMVAAIGLLSIIGFALVNAGTSVPGWMIALLPVAPLPFIAYGALQADTAAIRGEYIDKLERLLESPGLGFDGPTGHRQLSTMWKGRGRVLVGIAGVALLGMYVGVIVQSFRIAHDSDAVVAWIALLGCSGATATILGLYLRALLPGSAEAVEAREAGAQQVAEQRAG